MKTLKKELGYYVCPSLGYLISFFRGFHTPFSFHLPLRMRSLHVSLKSYIALCIFSNMKHFTDVINTTIARHIWYYCEWNQHAFSLWQKTFCWFELVGSKSCNRFEFLLFYISLIFLIVKLFYDSKCHHLFVWNGLVKKWFYQLIFKVEKWVFCLFT